MDRMKFGETFLSPSRNGIVILEEKTPSINNHVTVTPLDVLVSEVIQPSYQWNNSELFSEAKTAETSCLRERNTWKVVQKTLSINADIIGGRFANVLKNVGTKRNKRKNAMCHSETAVK